MANTKFIWLLTSALFFGFVVGCKDRKTSIGYSSVKDALEDLKKNPSAKFRDERGWTIVNVVNEKNQDVIWSFTPEGHPAHPAAISRTIYTAENKDVNVNMSALCEASKVECDKLMEEFKALQERVQNELSKKNA